jgi:tetratricopeptide (TPR) repeat protein
MLRFFQIIVLFFFISIATSAQDVNLANQYFANGEYEKATILYQQLSDSDPRNEFYFNRYVDCMMNLEQYEECEKSIKKAIFLTVKVKKKKQKSNI